MRANAFGLLVLVMPVLASLSKPVEAQEVITADLDGVSIDLVLPESYCPLDLDNPDERTIFDFYDGQRSQASTIILFFLECEELASLRRDGLGDVIALEDYGMYSVGSDTDGRIKTHPEMSRDQFVREAGKAFEVLDGEAVEQLAGDRFADIQSTPDSSVDFQTFGTTGQDENGVYLAVVVEAEVLGHRYLIAGASALTLLKDRQFLVTLSRNYDRPAVVSDLQREIRDLLAAFLAANPDDSI